ncbi:MAG: 3-oxoacyl-ACP reductase FabG [Deltaproteobacteria bacterium]|nr:3-oxoacyl-ACP reductase FabG [Deltaproteobacteria bacterium]
MEGVHFMDCMEKFRVDGKVIIVTGGSKGLGRAMALGLAQAGAKIVVASRSLDLIELTADEIIKKGGEAIAMPVDVRNPESIARLVKLAKDYYGRVDVLINNAGIAPMKKAVDTTLEDWEQVMSTNLKSAFLLSRGVGKIMLKQKKGKIINVGSILGTMAASIALPYCVSKAGIAHMTRALALEWGSHGINVNCIAPGFFETDMTDFQRMNKSHQKFLNFKIPFKRLGKPEEIVGAAIFLASEASDYMTGATLVIDGGYTIW